MLSYFLDSAKSIISDWNSLKTDTYAFQLSYKLMTGLLLICATVLATFQATLGPMDCFATNIPYAEFDDLLDTIDHSLCLVEGIYTSVNKTAATRFFTLYLDVPYHSNTTNGNLTGSPESRPLNRFYHRSYRWTWLHLLIMALIYLTPYYIWCKVDHHRIHRLIHPLCDQTVESHHELGQEGKKEMENLVRYFAYDRRRNTNSFAAKLALCEAFSVSVGIAQYYMTDYFLDGRFSYLASVIMSGIEPSNAIEFAFPSIAECSYKIGLELIMATCALMFNLAIGWFYAVLWCALVLVTTVQAIFLIYRLVVAMTPTVRAYVLTRKRVPREMRERVFKLFRDKCSYGDWFLIDLLGSNINNINVFCDFLDDLATKLQVPHEEQTTA